MPEVPSLMMFKLFLSFLSFRSTKSILAKASSSFKTMSMLSVPMPVERTVMFFVPILPVCVMNSLWLEVLKI